MTHSAQISGDRVDLLLARVVALVRLKDRDLSLRKLTILILCVEAEEPQRVIDLAQCLAIAKPSVSRSVDRLEAAKLARRQPNPRDQRSVLIVPSTAGRRFYARFFGAKSPRRLA